MTNGNIEKLIGGATEGNVERRMQEIEDELISRLDDDDRYGSGVPSHQRTNDVNFVRMSGITHLDETSEPLETLAEAENKAASAGELVSFFEEGVADVDERMSPGNIDASESGDGEFTAVQEESQAGY